MADTQIVTGPTGLNIQLDLNESRMLMNYLGRLSDGATNAEALAASVEVDGDQLGALDRLLTAITTACSEFFAEVAAHGKAGPRKSTGIRNSVRPRRDRGTGRQV